MTVQTKEKNLDDEGIETEKSKNFTHQTKSKGLSGRTTSGGPLFSGFPILMTVQKNWTK